VVLEWLDGFFYYSRRRSAFRELGHELFPAVMALTGRAIEAGRLLPAVSCACSALNWCVFNLRPPEEAGWLARLLDELFCDFRVPSPFRKQIGILFSTMASQFLDADPRAWARRTLQAFPDALEGHEDVQLRLSAMEGIDDALARHDEVMGSLRRYATWVREQDASLVERRYGQERLFDIVSLLAKLLADNGRINFLIEVLQAWYDTPEPRRGSGLLMCLPTHRDGILYAVEGRTHLVRRDPDPSIRAGTDAANRFLGAYISLSHDADLPPHDPERPGLPDARRGPAFERSLREHYDVETVAAALVAVQDGVRAMLSIPGQPHPPQAILLRSLGRTWPWTGSLQEPLPDRPLRRVPLWPGGTFPEQFEIEAVVGRLEAHGATVEVIGQEDLTAERFRAAYADPAYDALWIITHGIYNRWDPHTAYLQLSPDPGQRMYLDELVEVPVPGDRRRLLVLNVCDGGTVATLGGVLGIGIAPMVASAGQAVISHMWPVDQRVAPAFGALLAIRLAGGASFFSAYSYAVRSLSGGRDNLLAELRAGLPQPSPLVEHLERRNFDPDNITYWGSPVFYE
jgi:hypothetical protein